MLPKDWPQVNQFPQSLYDSIVKKVNEVCKSVPKPWIAAFDADGTLWDTDLGEAFFRYQIANCHLPNIPKDPWAHYEYLKKIDYALGCLWLAQINKGQKIETVSQWAEDCLKKSSPIPIFDIQKKLIEHLHKIDFKVYIVTASIGWAVEPASSIFNIPKNRILGMRTEVINGLVTDIGVPPLTYKEGKATGLLHATKGVKPLFCSGNSIGDLALLECSQGVRFVIGAQTEGEVFESEMKLQKISDEKNWFSLRLR